MDKEIPLQGGLTEACSGQLLDMSANKTHYYLLRECLNLEWGFSDHWPLWGTGVTSPLCDRTVLYASF